VPVVEECFICVKNYVTSAELWVDEDFEMIAVEVKRVGPKYTWEIVGIYRAPLEDIRVFEILAAHIGFMHNS
jgi:hypothetical protein